MANKCYTLGYPIPMLISLLILSLPIKLSSFYDKHDKHWHFRNCCTIGTEKNKKIKNKKGFSLGIEVGNHLAFQDLWSFLVYLVPNLFLISFVVSSWLWPIRGSKWLTS